MGMLSSSPKPLTQQQPLSSSELFTSPLPSRLLLLSVASSRKPGYFQNYQNPSLGQSLAQGAQFMTNTTASYGPMPKGGAPLSVLPKVKEWC